MIAVRRPLCMSTQIVLCKWLVGRSNTVNLELLERFCRARAPSNDQRATTRRGFWPWSTKPNEKQSRSHHQQDRFGSRDGPRGPESYQSLAAGSYVIKLCRRSRRMLVYGGAGRTVERLNTASATPMIWSSAACRRSLSRGWSARPAFTTGSIRYSP